MLTDWLLIRRAAVELERALIGARVQDVAKLPDGRLAIALWSRGIVRTLCIDVSAPTPLVELEGEIEFPIATDPGFVRSMGATLRGMSLAGARARRGDRVLRLDFTTRSRFGIAGGAGLVLELVPRFGNVILVKDDRVVSAMREFSLAQNGTRSVEAGGRYQPPPIEGRNLVPRLLSQSYSPERCREIVEAFGGENPVWEPLYVYRRAGMLVQAHVVALLSLDDCVCTREGSLLALFAEMAGEHSDGAANQTVERRRAALLKPLDAAEKKTRAELASIAAKRARALDRQAMRDEGDAIYASLHEATGPELADRKDRALALFAAYKKLGSSLPHLDAREAHLREQLESIVALQWETQRAAPSDLDEVAQAAAAVFRTRVPAPPKKTPQKKRRAPLQWRLPSGSRLFVGRTPQENADLTFRVARPDDLWFHVQGQPGAHAILARDDKQAPPHEDMIVAAAVAAFHSKAKSSEHVAVDYTLRKFVRKRSAAAPGLVYYTNPATLTVKPAEPSSEFRPDETRKRPS